MTDNTKAFKLDVTRILLIKDQVDRGEELSAEDVAYVKECVLAIAALLRPAVEAMGKAIEDFGRRMSEEIRRVKPPVFNVSQVITGPAPSAATARRVRDQIANMDRRRS